MNPIVNYIVESSIALGLLTSYYLLALRNSNQLQFKRLYLVFSLVFSAILPIHNFQLLGRVGVGPETTNTAYNLLETITVFGGNFSAQTVPMVKSHNWLIYFYIAGFLLLFVRMGFGLIRIGLMRGIFRSEKQNQFRYFVTEGKYRPFSFFKWIFIPHKLMEQGVGDIILTHEKEHARQCHSLDILLLEVVLTVQWFNPFVWIVRREIKNNHEFMADRAVLQSGVSKAAYLQSMMFEMLGTKFEMANNFSLSITQKRIKMMKTNNIKKYIFGKASMAVVLMFSLFLVFACESNSLVDETPDEPIPVEKDATLATPVLEIDEEQVFIVAEQMPQFPGGTEALMNFLSENVDYPPKAQEHGIQGRVYVSFIVDKSGEIRDVTLSRSVDPHLDAEAIRVIKSMPAWIPGKQRGKEVNVKFMIPVNFVLN